MTDSGSHFYDVYECADGGWLAVGPIESRFYTELLQILEIDPAELGPQLDPAHWPRAKALAERQVQDESARRLGRAVRATDACVAPVLDWVGGA